MKIITFETDRYNLSVEKDNFINPCCYGEDAATWLKSELEASEVEVKDLYQEDWGWEICCIYAGNQYYVGVGGNPETEGGNFGEWRLMLTKSRTILQTLLGKNKLVDADPFWELLNAIVSKSEFGNVQNNA